MTNEQAIEEIKSIISDMPSMECKDWIDALFMTIQVLEQQSTNTEVSNALYNQTKWERDIAIKKLHDLGYEFGENVESFVMIA